MKTYEVTFWTEPRKFRYARIEKRCIKARTRSEAIYDAEDKYPEWSIIAVKENEERKDTQSILHR